VNVGVMVSVMVGVNVGLSLFDFVNDGIFVKDGKFTCVLLAVGVGVGEPFGVIVVHPPTKTVSKNIENITFRLFERSFIDFSFHSDQFTS
jgi:hypothetical protein